MTMKMKPYGMRERGHRYESDDTRKTRRCNKGRRSITPHPAEEKTWKHRARQLAQKAIRDAE